MTSLAVRHVIRDRRPRPQIADRWADYDRLIREVVRRVQALLWRRRPACDESPTPSGQRWPSPSATSAGQQSADQYPPRDPRINQVWKRFLRSTTRRELAKALDVCFRCKCAYCEQVAAKDIEHFYPKGRYPKKMFRWVNLLRGCKNCNNAKRDKFPIQNSRPVLLNPCEAEPLDYFVWSFETGAMGVNPDPLKGQRATTTCEMFSLNQEPYREERRHKFNLVVYLLTRVVNEDPVSDETKERLAAELAPTRPWLGIIRQLLHHPGRYQELIKVACQKVPEIESWISEWL